MYDEIGEWSKSMNIDMIVVKKDNKWGFVRLNYIWSLNVCEAISPIYDAVESFSFNGTKTLVTLNGEQFYINRDGERV
jgi:hypothetical protein